MHACSVGPCDEACPDKNIMCRPHWKMVPPDLQRDVWRAFHAYEAHPGDRNRLSDLRTAQRRATEAVEAKLSG